jgi:hypothetical protein
VEVGSTAEGGDVKKEHVRPDKHHGDDPCAQETREEKNLTRK